MTAPVEVAAAVGSAVVVVVASEATGGAATVLIYAVGANMQHHNSYPAVSKSHAPLHSQMLQAHIASVIVTVRRMLFQSRS